MFNEPDAGEKQLLPVYVFGSAKGHSQPRIERKNDMNACQLTLVRSGRGIFRGCDGREYMTSRNDVIYFASGTAHAFEPIEGEWIVDYIVFDGNAIRQLERLGFTATGVIRPTGAQFPEIERLFDEIIRVNNAYGRHRHSECSRMLYRLIIRLSECMGDAAAEIKRKSDMLMPCMSYISAHFSEDISIANIAEMVGISPTYFGIVFKEVYGVTPKKYIIAMRLKEAKKLLVLRKHMSIGRVSECVGFASSGYFCNKFREYVGLTPGEYRARNTYAD